MKNMVLKNIILVINVYDYIVKIKSLKLNNTDECIWYMVNYLPNIVIRDNFGYIVIADNQNVIELHNITSECSSIFKYFQDELSGLILKYINFINTTRPINVTNTLLGNDLKINIELS